MGFYCLLQRQMASPIYLEKNNFFFKSVLGHEPQAASKFCIELQKQWHEVFSSDVQLAESMTKWKKIKTVHLVWVSDRFGDELPEDVNELKTHRLLSEIYDASVSDNVDLGTDSDQAADLGGADSENNRASERQLKQHLRAFLLLINEAKSCKPLSEELILKAHQILMKGLYRDGMEIHAGHYREISVYTGGAYGGHTYIDYESVLPSMKKLVAEYNQRVVKEHDSVQLASWLLLEMLQIHPFEDGNGRLSRLLWCYSLLRDGLPFPVTPFPGSKKAYRKYIMCIQRDSDSFNHSYKHMNSLTLISITKTWKNYISNLRLECSEKYGDIIAWLKESDNLLKEKYNE